MKDRCQVCHESHFQMCPSEILLVLELGGYDSGGVVQMEFGQCTT